MYDGFISYSHAADDLLAPRLQAGLQRFAKPWWKRRAVRVFRDETSLSANPHLWSSITEALDSSEWFVLLLSPDAAVSPWVNQEIQYWKVHKDSSRILPVLTDGSFDWDGDVVGDAVPDQLRGVFSEEPRWVDLRFAKDEENLDLKDPRFADAVADIASALRGIPKDELASEEVKQHRRTVRTAWAAAALVGVLAVAAVVFGIQSANNARIAEKNEATAIAEAERADANAAQAQANEKTAIEEAERADKAARLAQGKSLLSASRVMAAEDADLALLLALEAAELLDESDSEVEEVLHSLLLKGRGRQELPVTADSLTASFTVAVSPDGTVIAASAAGNEVSLFEAATLEQLRTLGEGSPDEEVSSSIPGMDFSKDGSRVSAIGTDGVARIWDVDSGELVIELDTGEGDTGFVRFADDDRLLITSIHTRTAWELSTLQPVWIDRDAAQAFGGAPIDVDRTGLVVAWANKGGNHIKAVDVRTGETLWVVEEPVPTFVDFHPSLDVLLTKPQTEEVRIYSTEAGNPQQIHSFRVFGPSAVAFSPDGSRFVVANENETLVYHAENPADPSAQWFRSATLSTGGALPLAMSFLGTDRVAIGQPGRVAVWEVDSKGEIARHETGRFYWRIEAVPGTPLVVVAEPGLLGGNALTAYDISTGEIEWVDIAPPVDRRGVHGGAVSVIRRDLAFGYLPFIDALATFNPVTGEPIDVVSDLSSGEPAPQTVDIDATLTWAAAATVDSSETTVWDLSGSRDPIYVDAGVGRVTAVRFSPDGARLAIGGTNGLAVVDLVEDASVAELPSEGLVFDIAFSIDGTLMAATDDTFGLLSVYETETWGRLQRLPLPGALTPRFSSDGSQLVVAAAQSGIVSLDLETWDTRWTVPRQDLSGAVLFADLDGDRFVFVDTLGALQEITLDRMRLLETARSRLTRSFDSFECVQYRIDPCPTLEEMRAG